MTYAELQTQIAGYLHRTDLAILIPNFIARAETAILREINIKDIETSVEGVTAGALIALPADFASITRLTITHGGREYDLDYAAHPVSHAAGVPTGYTHEGRSLRLYPEAGTGYPYTLYYTPIIAPLSATITSNWLLVNAADIYLYASALEGARYLRDMEQVAALNQMIGPLVDSIRRLSQRRGLPAKGGLQIKLRN